MVEQDGLARLARIMEAGFNTLADLQRETNARLDQTNTRLDQLSTDVGQLRAEIAAGLARHEEALAKLIRQGEALNERFDNFLLGAHRAEHDGLRQAHELLATRVERLERGATGHR